tara:strand:+ start:647 stop:1804 length:1158 start_codon:yes stop_codon:yes gene_type:complete
MNNIIYDLVVIGGGISSCTFLSNLLKKGFNGKVGIIETGRGLGGRCSTRISKKNIGFVLNHGAPNFNIVNKSNDKNLNSFLNQLIDKNIIEKDNSLSIELDQYLNSSINFSNEFCTGDIYSSTTTMSNLANQILSLNNINKQIDFYFQEFIIELFFRNNIWFLKSKEGNIFHTKFLVISSNLLLHKRSKEILGVDEIPLAKALKGNAMIEEIINKLNFQNYIERINFLIYTKKEYQFNEIIKKNNIIFYLDDNAQSKYGFERIIFQKQKNKRYGIVLHSKKDNNFIKKLNNDNFDIFKKEIIHTFNKLFEQDPLINILDPYVDISIMRWRASQPRGLGVPLRLQICNECNIAFCGDWFDIEGFGRVEGAILSGLNLSENFFKSSR